METEAGSQVSLETSARGSPPFLAHQFFPGGRPRDTMSSGRQAPYASRPILDSPPHNLASVEHGQYNNGHRMDWDVKSWDWDSALFLAQPSSSAAAVSERAKSLGGQGAQNVNPAAVYHQPSSSNGVGLQLDGVRSTSPDPNGSSDHDDPYARQRRKQPVCELDDGLPSYSDKTQPFLRDGSSPEEDTESLSLKLGGHSYAYSDDGNGLRDAKRYRSSSPGPQFPSCQVDDCKADLSHAKDYHRRHKVCEMHAKAVKALVSRLMQRFCQQCSRFHPLTEFDEGKRSCRRRLAGHNRRRRKNQPDPPTGRGYMGVDEDGTGKAVGLMGVLNLLSTLQASVNSVGALNGIVNERDVLLQYLKKGGLAHPSGLENLTTASLANLLSMSGAVLESGRHDLKPQPSIPNGHTQSAVAETEALLSALAAPKTTEALSLLLQNSLREQLTSAIMNGVSETPLVKVGQSNGNSTLPVASPSSRMSDKVDHANARPVLSFSSAMSARPAATAQHVASSSGPNGIHQQVIPENLVQRTDLAQAQLLQGQVTPLSVVQKLYSQASECRSTINGKFSVNLEDDGATESTSNPEAAASMMTFLEGQDARTLQDVASFHLRPTIDLQQPPPSSELNDSSPSGSDQSPSCSYPDWQDRTGRISFKLFDKNPGELPQLLRSQIMEWLAHRPSDMESYIRPGCTVLTIFLSMSKLEWEEVERDLRISLLKLVSSCEFWSKGRIHVQVDRRNAFVIDGKIHVSKPLKPMVTPQLLSVWPIAVVAGQRTMIVVRGCNLKQTDTRIFCAYQGKYVVKMGKPQGDQRFATEMVENGGPYDELSINFDGGLPNIVGRAFIEVEKQMGGGNALPVIVADGPICAELQMLDKIVTPCTDDHEGLQRMRHQSEDSLHQVDVRNFLNGLGWLFQKSQVRHGGAGSPQLLPSREKRLLTFAVERDWCAVVNKLLDILFGLVLASPDKMSAGLVEIFGDEVSLLHTAVRRKCRPMVMLLLSYVPYSGAGKADMKDLEDISRNDLLHRSIFTPDRRGPDGDTPLHIAATMDGVEGIIDALTNDPNQIGLCAWSSSRNAMGESPLACALRRGNTSYVHLVRRKIAKRDGVETIDIPLEGKQSSTSGDMSKFLRTTPLCALELPVWSKKDPVNVTGAGGKTLIYPSSCRHLPPSLRGFRRSSVYRPFLVSMVAIAAVCVCACVVTRGLPEIRGILPPFSWSSLQDGTS